MEILIIEDVYPTFHRFGIGRALGSNLAEPGEPRPRPIPTPTTTPLSGWVITCAVWAKPSALLVRGGLARSGALPFAQRSYAGQHYVSEVEVDRLRYAQTDHLHLLHSASALLRCASLSIAPPRSLDQKAVFGTATQSQAFMCGVGKALRLACSLLAPCCKTSPNLLKKGRSGALVGACSPSAAVTLP